MLAPLGALKTGAKSDPFNFIVGLTTCKPWRVRWHLSTQTTIQAAYNATNIRGTCAQISNLRALVLHNGSSFWGSSFDKLTGIDVRVSPMEKFELLRTCRVRLVVVMPAPATLGSFHFRVASTENGILPAGRVRLKALILARPLLSAAALRSTHDFHHQPYGGTGRSQLRLD